MHPTHGHRTKKISQSWVDANTQAHDIYLCVLMGKLRDRSDPLLLCSFQYRQPIQRGVGAWSLRHSWMVSKTLDGQIQPNNEDPDK